MPLREAVVQNGRPVRLPDLACTGNESVLRSKPGVDHIDGVVHGQRDVEAVGSPGLVFSGERVVSLPSRSCSMAPDIPESPRYSTGLSIHSP